jgi:hypothetical protein
MSKTATVASQVRIAARTEAEFYTTVQEVLDDNDPDRIVEFFDRMNIPRSIPCENVAGPLEPFKVNPSHLHDFETERRISDGVQKFMDRHERKLKWHATHPSLEGGSNVALLVRTSLAITEMRLQRLDLLLRSKDDLTAVEWSIARELMRHGFLSIRNHINVLAGAWVDAVITAVPRVTLIEQLGSFYEVVDRWIRRLDEMRDRLEERRMMLTVVPAGHPPVRPPNYFGGDVLGRGPWKQYWDNLENRAHHFREALG